MVSRFVEEVVFGRGVPFGLGEGGEGGGGRKKKKGKK